MGNYTNINLRDVIIFDIRTDDKNGYNSFLYDKSLAKSALFLEHESHPY